jgi:two-component system, cell cycle sensor histidine kinase and response regulator CckA
VIHDPQFHASVLDQVQNAVIGTDPEGGIVYWNRAAETVYQWTAAEVLGRNIVEVTVPPESLNIARRILEGLTNAGYWQGEFRVRRKDGSTFPAFVTDSVVRGADGAVAGYVGITTDLTAQKAAEDKYRRVIDTAGEGICMIDPAGRAEFVNRRMAEMLGYDFAATPAVDSSELIFDDDRDAARALFNRRRERELRLRRRDGSALWTRISASPVRDEGGALWMVTDISERIAGEQKLRRLAEANIIGVLTADPEKILDANSIFLDMVGYTREDLEAGRLRWPEMTPSEYEPLDRRAVTELVERGACQPFEKELFRKDGSRVPVLIGAALLSDKPNWLCFVLDLTERNRAEEALRAVRHMESVGFLAGGVAHNLNNMLVAVIGSASLLMESNLLPSDRQLAEDILKSGERAAELTRQLLAYSGKGGYMVQPLAVSSVIEGLASVFRASVPKQIDLRYHLAPELPPIEADEGHLHQLVTDLVINASEAIGGAAGTIDVSTRLASVNGAGRRIASGVGELVPGRYIVIEVADTGAGMDDHTRARLFDPFFTTKFTGRGLGLAAVAGIVRRHRGAIEVLTERGKGSTFRVYLPA